MIDNCNMDERMLKAIQEARAIMETEGFHITTEDLLFSETFLQKEKEKVYYYERTRQNDRRSIRNRRNQSACFEE